MAGLYETLQNYGRDSSAMENLARSCQLRDSAQTSEAYIATIPFVIEGLRTSLESAPRIDQLLAWTRAFSWSERDDPREVINTDNLTLGGDAVATIFSNREVAARYALIEQTSVAPASAQKLLEITSLLALASLAGGAGGAVSRMSFVATIRSDRGSSAAKHLAAAELAESNSLTSDDADPDGGSTAAIAGSASTTVQDVAPAPLVSTAKRGRSTAVLVGVGLALLAAAVAFGALTFGGGSDETASADDIAVESPPLSEDVPVESLPLADDVPAETPPTTIPPTTTTPPTTAPPVESDTEAESDQTVPPVEEEAVDDWPGGRGPVPEGPSIRRTLEIDPAGGLVLSGSAPSYEVAVQAMEAAQRNFPVSGIAIANELTWHPEGASSVRSGDAVIPAAATFASGSSELVEESLPALDLAVDILNASPSIYLVVVGHTDAVGDAELNASLSADRVAAAVDYLLANGAIPGQIVTAAAGEDDPSASNETSDGRQSNRRVELLFKNFLAPFPGDDQG